MSSASPAPGPGARDPTSRPSEPLPQPKQPIRSQSEPILSKSSAEQSGDPTGHGVQDPARFQPFGASPAVDTTQSSNARDARHEGRKVGREFDLSTIREEPSYLEPEMGHSFRPPGLPNDELESIDWKDLDQRYHDMIRQRNHDEKKLADEFAHLVNVRTASVCVNACREQEHSFC